MHLQNVQVFFILNNNKISIVFYLKRRHSFNCFLFKKKNFVQVFFILIITINNLNAKNIKETLFTEIIWIPIMPQEFLRAGI